MNELAFYWYDIPAQMRKKWWSMSNDNRQRMYAYYRKRWILEGGK